MAVWDDVLPVEEQEIYRLAGYGSKMGLGLRPALLIVDVCNCSFGDRPEPITESIKRFPVSCGMAAWQALPYIQQLLTKARAKGIPIAYSTYEFRPESKMLGSTKRRSGRKTADRQLPWELQIVDAIAPQPGEAVIYKQRASAFFGTPLISYLVRHGVDTLLVCGTTTSGCVRASVVDAFSNGYRVAVVEECTFDRTPTPHKINLWDMNSKYADVIGLADALAYLDELPL